MTHAAILQSLASFNDRLAKEDDAGAIREGFEKKEIPFVIKLDRGGNFVGLQDTRQGEGKKKPGRSYTVPKAVKRSSGIAENLLWDNPAYVIGKPKPDKKRDYRKLLDRAKDQHADFVSCIEETFPPSVSDEGIVAVKKFLGNGDFSKLFAHPDWQEVEGNGFNLSFQLAGDTGLICQREDIVKAIKNQDAEGKVEKQTCLVTGKIDEPVRLHTAIQGVW